MKSLSTFISEQAEVHHASRFDANDSAISSNELMSHRIIHTSNKDFEKSIDSTGLKAFSGKARDNTVHQDAPDAIFCMLVDNFDDAWNADSKDSVFYEVDAAYANTLEWFEDNVEKTDEQGRNASVPYAIYTMSDIESRYITKVVR